jgi:hypothetical protein
MNFKKMTIQKINFVFILFLICNIGYSKELKYYHFEPFYNLHDVFASEIGYTIDNFESIRLKSIKKYSINLKYDLYDNVVIDSTLLFNCVYDSNYNPVYLEKVAGSGNQKFRINFINKYDGDILKEVKIITNDSNEYLTKEKWSILYQNKIELLGKFTIYYTDTLIGGMYGEKNPVKLPNPVSSPEYVNIFYENEGVDKVVLKGRGNNYTVSNYNFDGKIKSKLYGKTDSISVAKGNYSELDTLILFDRDKCKKCYLAKTVYTDRLFYIGDFCNDDEIKIVINYSPPQKLDNNLSL